ncbi:MAG TPA: hypothetical protein VK066_07955 [Chloroflexota bacterium]|nr:hypothetical protein [Chloroflexota bacterium]
MAERASIAQVVQLGVETTPGTSTAANKLLQSISIEPSIQANISLFRPMGTKYPTVQALGQEWSQASIKGQPTYTELIYLLSSILKSVTPTQIIPTTGQAYSWLFDPSSTSEDTVKTFTVEQGSAVRAHKFSYGIVPELGMTFSRKDIALTGTMLGQNLTDGITLTATPTAIPLVPILPKQLDVYIDPSSAGLGTTKANRVLSGSWTLSGRFGPLWTVNSANNSFAAHVETEPKLELKLLLEADAEGMGYLAAARQGDTRFIRLAAAGAQIEAGPPASTYLFQLDLAGKVSGVGPFADSDGVYAIEWTFQAVHDATWGRALQVKVVNTQTSL